jgi:hypothetical protein
VPVLPSTAALAKTMFDTLAFFTLELLFKLRVPAGNEGWFGRPFYGHAEKYAVDKSGRGKAEHA